ncbi:MAG: FAD-dependent oxidoreductase, partial [Candidatus Omnitrophota bacterium]
PGCPLGVDIPGFVRLLREGDAVAALDKIKKDNPFPALCGRVCTAPCESACIFYDDGSPIAIRALERYAADFGYKPNPKIKSIVNLNGKKVALVGSGPSAMAAASVLLKDGYKVVMFEAAAQVGGLLRYGIPEFRLPQEVLDAQFDELLSQGLEIHTNIFVGRMKPLEELTRSFDAVLLALGASLPDFSSMEGENLAGVYYAEEFLIRLQILSKENLLMSMGSLLRGKETVVIGRGYAALDAARMAVRLGQEVQWVFRGLEEELGLSSHDLKKATEEGIHIHSPFEAIKIVGDIHGFVEGLQCQQLEIVETQEGLSLQPSKEDVKVFNAQTVILANGQKVNSFLATTVPQLKVNANGAFWVDEATSMTSLDKVFATASIVKGPVTIVEAIASGKKVAKQIASYLKP